MKLNPKSLVVGLILLEILIVAVYVGSILLTGRPLRAFDMNGEMTIPSLLQAWHLFTMGFISLIFVLVQGKTSERPSRLFLWTIGVLLIYASVDEIFKVHLQFHKWFPMVHTRNWMGVYIAIMFGIPVVFYRDFKALWDFHRKSVFLALLGMGTFMVGGFGSEIFKYTFLERFLWKHFQHSHVFIVFVEQLRVAFEEYLELLGETFILYGVLLFVAKRLEKVPSKNINDI